MTAILETIIAVPLYWWIALQTGVIEPLLVSVVIAPLVLLRSENSVAFGAEWFLRFEEKVHSQEQYGDLTFDNRRTFCATSIILALIAIALTCLIVLPLSSIAEDWLRSSNIALIFLFLACAVLACAVLAFAIFFGLSGIAAVIVPIHCGFIIIDSNDKISRAATLIAFPSHFISVVISSAIIRIAATVVHLADGIRALPRNFRRITICTSPAQPPELVPGIEDTDSQYNVHQFLREFARDKRVGGIEIVIPLIMGLILFAPAWCYRLTIKSTAWFWWPLAFLGGDLREARNPARLQWNMMGSLWAKASIAGAFASLVAFVVINLVLDGAVFHQRNPLLTPLGYLLLVNWKLRPWQVCGLIVSVLSIVLVFWLNDASGKYRIALQDQDAGRIRVAEQNFGWIERLARLRLLLSILFWCLVGAHATLYVNSTRCWFSLPPSLHTWAQDIYGDRLPPENCSGGSRPTKLGAILPLCYQLCGKKDVLQIVLYDPIRQVSIAQ